MAGPPDAGSLLDHPRIGRSYFFPRPAPIPDRSGWTPATRGSRARSTGWTTRTR